MNPILPVIHSNGTSPETLRDDYEAAFRAVNDALRVIEKIEFNARDYYCHPEPGAWDEARKAHTKCAADIRAAGDYYLAIAGHCQDAIDEKEKRTMERQAGRI